jgi:hypothetical protein
MSCETESCPFANTEVSEQVQNYGCLPTPQEIIDMRVQSGKTWACHSNTKIPCKGALSYLKGKGLECKVLDSDLITEKHDWPDLINY